MLATIRRLALLCLLPSALVAQRHSRMTGVTAGLNLATLGGEDTQGASDGRVGLAFGAFGSFLLSQAVAFQPEVLFIQKGADFTTAGTTGGAIRFDYIQIPLLLRLRVATGEAKAVPFVTLGPSIAFRIGCDAGVSTPGGFVSQGCDAFTSSDISSTDFSALAGAGVEVGNLILTVRYDYSFTSLHLSGTVDKVYNRGFAIMAAYGFRAW